MTFSAAIAEARASGDDAAVWILTAEIIHPGLEGNLYLAMGVEGAEPADKVKLRLVSDGPFVDHICCAFAFTPPGSDRDGPTDAKVAIDGVSGELKPHLDAMRGWNIPALLNFREYRVTSTLAAANGPDDDTLAGLELRNIRLTADTAEGTLSWPDGRTLNVPTGPNAVMDRETYPDLW